MRKKTKFPLIHHQYHLPLILLLIILVTGLITGIYLALTPQDIRQRAQTPVTPPGPTSCSADINQDNIVDITDYAILAQNFLKNLISNPKADINTDNIVDLSDYAILAKYFLKPCP